MSITVFDNRDVAFDYNPPVKTVNYADPKKPSKAELTLKDNIVKEAGIKRIQPKSNREQPRNVQPSEVSMRYSDAVRTFENQAEINQQAHQPIASRAAQEVCQTIKPLAWKILGALAFIIFMICAAIALIGTGGTLDITGL